MRREVLLFGLFLTALALVGCSDSSKDKAAIPEPLAIATQWLPEGTVGVPYTMGGVATGGTGSYTWSIEQGDLPSGLSLNGSTGQITGTPDTETECTLTLCVTDSTDSHCSKQFTIKVNTITIISPSPLPEGKVGEPYLTVLTAIGGTSPYTWSVDAGSLPSGLSLDSSTGEATGTPDAECVATFTIGATDAASNYGSKEFTLEVHTITISTPSYLPDGKQGQPYSTTTLEAADGVAPYQWYLESGSLPSGIALDHSAGEISGIPQTSGLHTFSVGVMDSESSYGKKEFYLMIQAGGPTVVVYADQAIFTGHVRDLTKHDPLETAEASRRGWIKFDLSSVPAWATVVNVTIYWYVTRPYGSYTFDIVALSQDPVTSDAATIWDDMTGATVYRYDQTAPGGGWQSLDLGLQAASDLAMDAMGKKWFAIGLVGEGAGGC